QPSWLGVRYAPVPAALRTARPALAGAAQIQSVEDGSPAEEAGLQPTDVVLGPPGQPFKSSAELRDWTMTAPEGVALPLKTVRLGTSDSTNGGEFEAMVVLRPPRKRTAAAARDAGTATARHAQVRSRWRRPRPERARTPPVFLGHVVRPVQGRAPRGNGVRRGERHAGAGHHRRGTSHGREIP